MLIDIVRMPPVFGIPIDRHYTINNGYENHFPIDDRTVVWSGLPIYRDQLSVGTPIGRTPSQLYKAIHISDDSHHAFETVFSMEPEGAVCLYTKITNCHGTRMGISVEAVKFYQNHQRHLFPLSHFLISNRLPGINSIVDQPLILHSPIDNIVPPILDLKLLQNVFQQALENGLEIMNMRIAAAYQPLYYHLPSVMEALLTGRFVRPPFTEFPDQHPSVILPKDRWFFCDKLKFSAEVKGTEVYVNHPGFDEAALDIMAMLPTRFMITSLMSHALDALDDLWTTIYYEDSYALLTGLSFQNQKKTLIDILYRCAVMYCKIYQIDSHAFMNTQVDRSSITIGRNIYDEIEISIHDLINDRYVSFYSSFPALALSTLSIGWYN